MHLKRTILLSALVAAAACDSSSPTATGIGSTGGTAASSNDNAHVIIPAGALGTNTVITVAPAASPPASAGLVAASAFDFGPTGTTFSAPVTITIKYDPATIPANVAESTLQLYTLAGSTWTLVAGSSVDASAHTVTGTTTHFSEYAPMGVVVTPVATVAVAPAATSIGVGATSQLTAVTKDASGATLTGRSVSWSSSDPTKASVSSSGLVTGIAAGAVTITATSETKTGTSAVTVTQVPVASVTVAPATASLVAGSTATLTATTKDASGNTLTGRTVAWTSSDATKATVSSSGVVTGVATGSATITATSEGIAGTSAVTVTAVAPPPGASIQPLAISTGDDHACGLNSSGAAYCWGSNGNDALGDGTNTDSKVPVAVTGGLTFAVIQTHLNLSCGLTAAGALYCWGGGSQLFSIPTATAVAPGITFSSISVNSNHVCGVATDGSGHCVGTNTYGQLGTGQTSSALPSSSTFVTVTGGQTWKQIAVSNWSTCGITTAGALYCWGNIASYNSGTGAVSTSPTPVLITNAVAFASLTRGIGTTAVCGLNATGAAYCVGSTINITEFGGTPGATAQVPAAVGGSMTFKLLTHSSDDLCGISSSNALYCWGNNGHGQLGQGNNLGAPTSPTLVMSGTSFSAVDNNDEGSICAVATTGTGYCWGYNFSGQIGDGTNSTRFTPTPISGGISFRTP